MSDKDLARMWAKIRKGKSEASPDSSEERMLSAIARQVDRDNETCPEPPADLQRRIMTALAQNESSFQQRLQDWWQGLVPITVTVSVLIVTLLLLEQSGIRQQFWPDAPVISPDLSKHSGSGRIIHYNDGRVIEATNGIKMYAEQSLGALALVLCSVGAVLCALWKRFRTALVMLVITVLMLLVLAFLSTLTLLA